MQFKHSQLIDSERREFKVLDIAEIELFARYNWHGEDINGATAIGSAFRTLENPVTGRESDFEWHVYRRKFIHKNNVKF